MWLSDKRPQPALFARPCRWNEKSNTINNSVPYATSKATLIISLKIITKTIEKLKTQNKNWSFSN